MINGISFTGKKTYVTQHETKVGSYLDIPELQNIMKLKVKDIRFPGDEINGQIDSMTLTNGTRYKFSPGIILKEVTIGQTGDDKSKAVTKELYEISNDSASCLRSEIQKAYKHLVRITKLRATEFLK